MEDITEDTTHTFNGKKRFWPALVLAALACVGGAISLPGPATEGAAAINGADTAWVLTATALVLLMTPGLAFFYGGMVSRRHVVSTMLQSYVAMGVVTLLWVTVGFSLAFGDSIGGLIGDPRTFFLFKGVNLSTDPALAPTIPLALFALFQLKFAIITPALITGAFAERIRFGAFITFMCFFALFVYAPLAHWTWHPNGILRQWGVLDFAGGTVVHMAAGFAGLAGALAVGKRGTSAPTPASVPYVLLGTGLLWFGWFGFNAGSALGANEAAVSAFLTTNTAAGVAMIAWLLTDFAAGRRVTALGASIGAVVGLVAITPAAGFVTVGGSIVIGVVASIVSNLVVSAGFRDVCDDTLDVFACHGVGGLVGMLLTAVFATTGGLITGDPVLLGKHAAASILVAAFTFGVSFVALRVVSRFVSLRAGESDERPSTGAPLSNVVSAS